MKICKHQFEYEYTIDKALPFGDIVSIAVFKCKICKKEVTIDEIQDYNTTRT
jgi:hypothetical protein